MIGTRLGPYEITAKLGAGGMGEVYKATDPRLGRTVAIKVLPSHLSDSPELKQRLDREARAISQLQHPHICALFDVGHQDGTDYLVMEYLEGESLADRLAKGPLPLEQTLRAGTQIAEALDRAHRQGIVHRDLKPGNVMLTKSGVKLLDFGLAKLQSAPSSAAGAASGAPMAGLPTQLSVDQPLTSQGTLLGTFQYMAPEQLEGQDADARTDLWALGCVLYEMATGQRAFAGKSHASLISAIMTAEPRPLSQLQPMTPPALDRLVRTCLQKDPDERWQSAHDVAGELRWIAEGGSQVGPAPVATHRRRRAPVSWWIAALATLFALGVGAWALRRAGPPPALVRLSLVNPTGMPFAAWRMAAVSPDGRRIAFVGVLADGKRQLWLRDLANEEPRALAGTDGAEQPFWSPDGRHLGFFAHGRLARIDASGGPPRDLCAAPVARGGSWGGDGTILFSSIATEALQRVSAEGGSPAPATRLGPREESHRWPSFLPDGRRFVFLGDAVHAEDHHLKMGVLGSLETTDLTQAISNPVYADPGYLLYVRGGVLLAQRLDEREGRLTGDPLQLADQIAVAEDNHLFEFGASPAGLLTYRSASQLAQLEWLDRAGRRLGAVGEPQRMGPKIALSPDGKRIAWEKLDSDGRHADIWLLDLERGLSSRFTLDPASDFSPAWAPAGDQLAWGSYRSGGGDLYAGSPFSPGSARLLLGSPAEKAPESWTASYLLFNVTITGPSTGDEWLLPLSPPGEPRPLIATAANEFGAAATRDGRWIAYVSDESGRPEVYVQPYPLTGRRWQISSDGGTAPRWRADGRELFFVDLQSNLVSIAVDDRAGFATGPPQKLFPLESWTGYDVAADGSRFLVARPLEDRNRAPITVVLNWRQALKAAS